MAETLSDHNLQTLRDYNLQTLRDYNLQTLPDYNLQTLHDYNLQTLPDYKLARGLVIHTRFDDLDLISRSHAYQNHKQQNKDSCLL